MSISPRVLGIIKTAFFTCTKESDDTGKMGCRVCDRNLEFSMAHWELTPNGQPWSDPDQKTVPWPAVRESWLRATGHHPECPIKELADLVLSLEECLDEEFVIPEPPPPPALDARTMARVAMHFCAHVNQKFDAEFAPADNPSDTLNWDIVVGSYETALGGTPDEGKIERNSLYNPEWHAGFDKQPLPEDDHAA